MRSLKDRGTEEVAALKNRTARQYGLGRISKTDHDDIQEALGTVQGIIDHMKEDEGD